MTAQILKSSIKDEGEFRSAIEALIAAKMAALDGGPMPAHSFLDQFIKRTRQGDPKPDLLEVDYELIDDTPPPPTEAEARAKAVADLRRQEADEIEKILPSHKRRLFEMDANRLQIRLAKNPSEGVEKALAEIKAVTDAIAAVQYAYAQREAAL